VRAPPLVFALLKPGVSLLSFMLETLLTTPQSSKSEILSLPCCKCRGDSRHVMPMAMAMLILAAYGNCLILAGEPLPASGGPLRATQGATHLASKPGFHLHRFPVVQSLVPRATNDASALPPAAHNRRMAIWKIVFARQNTITRGTWIISVNRVKNQDRLLFMREYIKPHSRAHFAMRTRSRRSLSPEVLPQG
jgi:hypothetical protein